MSRFTLNLDDEWSRLEPVLDAWERALGRGCGAWLLKVPPPLLGQPCSHPRPCRYYQCRWHMAVEWSRAGRPSLVHPETALADLEHTCLWDVVNDSPRGLPEPEIGRKLGLSQQRVHDAWVSGTAELRKADKQVDGALFNALRRGEE